MLFTHLLMVARKSIFLFIVLSSRLDYIGPCLAGQEETTSLALCA